MQTQLTPRQIRILLVGYSAGAAGRGFLSEGQELAAWFRHRDEILAAAGPARPHAYRKFELCQETPEWIRASERAFRRGVYSAQEVARLEQTNPTLAPDQPAELHQELETPETVRALQPHLQDLEVLLREFGHAEAFHAFRNRPKLAAKYARIGRALRTVLRESWTIPKLKEEEK
jgi:hypothetical protein